MPLGGILPSVSLLLPFCASKVDGLGLIMQTGFLSLAVLIRLVLGSAVLSERSPGPECLVMSVLSTGWVYDYVYQDLSFLGSMRKVPGILESCPDILCGDGTGASWRKGHVRRVKLAEGWFQGRKEQMSNRASGYHQTGIQELNEIRGGYRT